LLVFESFHEAFRLSIGLSIQMCRMATLRSEVSE
jgi:hypothetical protein